MCFYSSTVGKKVVVAVTGLILLGFVIGHLLGNLQVFAGPEKLNQYAVFLRNTSGVLWGTRLVLIVSVVLHVLATIQLTALNKASRPISYVKVDTMAANLPSRIMIWSGVFLAFYIVYHVLHFTSGTVHPNFQPHDVYANVIQGFSSWSVSLFYILAMGALGLHLFHGIWSMFQTLGLNHEKYNRFRRPLAITVTLAITLGYISIPIAVLLGVLR